MDFSTRLLSLRRRLPAIGSWQAYLFALGLLALGALLRAPFDASVNQRLPPFLTIYPMVVIASFAGGVRVGAVTAAAGGLLAWLLWAEPYGWRIPPYAVITFVVYVLAVGITVAAAGLARHWFDAVAGREQERSREARETVHRLKNLIAVVQALAHKTAKQSPDLPSFLGAFDQRLGALAAAQDILVRAEFGASDINVVVSTALGPFLPNAQLDIAGGPSLVMPARAVSGISLALYELATNATKYGALSDDAGTIVVSWRKTGARATLEWRESASIAPRNRDGAGAAVIRGALNTLPGGRVRYEIDGGVHCVFDWPEA